MAAKTHIKEALEPKSVNSSHDSRLHAATELRSTVTPADYPEDERDAQVTMGTAPKRNGAGGREFVR